MEDIFSIVWIVIVGTVAVGSAMFKSRKRARSAAKSAQNVRPANRRPDFGSPGNRPVAAYDGRSDLQRADSMQTCADTAAVDDPAGSESLQAESDRISAETFDVKRAVIYAEILQPKFKE